MDRGRRAGDGEVVRIETLALRALRSLPDVSVLVFDHELRCMLAAGSPLLLPERYGYVSSAYVRPAARRRGVRRRRAGGACVAPAATGRNQGWLRNWASRSDNEATGNGCSRSAIGREPPRRRTVQGKAPGPSGP